MGWLLPKQLGCRVTRENCQQAARFQQRPTMMQLTDGKHFDDDAMFPTKVQRSLMLLVSTAR